MQKITQPIEIKFTSVHHHIFGEVAPLNPRELFDGSKTIKVKYHNQELGKTLFMWVTRKRLYLPTIPIDRFFHN